MKSRYRRIWGNLGILLTLALTVGCGSNVLPNLPREMEGVWTTDDPRFSGRFMELSPSFVIIVTGHDDAASVQFIDKVETQAPGDFSSLTVYSTDYSEAHTIGCDCNLTPPMVENSVSRIRASCGNVM